MSEQKGGTDDGEESHGEFVGLRSVDDSGVESGEDLRGVVNPEVMREVEEALGRLEGVMEGLDPSRRVAVAQLMSTLQSCLKLPLKRRLTVGVSSEELAAARKWYEPPGEEMVLEYIAFRPVALRPGLTIEPSPQKAIISHIQATTERSLSGESGSLRDYDPSLVLFTPEESVQIAIHKAAINKQISKEEKRRESSEDGDISSDEYSEVNRFNEVSSAQRLLLLATESAKKNPSAARFHNRSSRKLKIKRANTIDIPKPANFYEYSSGDEYGASADEVNNGFERRRSSRGTAFLPPSFEPKTENDLKFLAFLKQVNDNQPKVQTYNPLAGGGKHWHNRFSSIKTAFENPESKPVSAAPSPAKMFWQNAETGKSKLKEPPSKLPWTVKTDNDGVVVGSLTVTKPGHVNKFNHAPKSAFKPIEKKPSSTVSGTVKQIAAQKFSEKEPKIEKPIIKPKPISSSYTKSLSNHSQNGNNSVFNYSNSNNDVKSSKSSGKFYESNKQYPILYDSAKPYSSTPKSFSKVSNGTSYSHNSSSSASPNKKIVDGSRQNSSNFEYKSINNNEYLSKAQQTTHAAKKQFLESTVATAAKRETKPSDFYFDQPSDVNHNKILANGSSNNTNSNPQNPFSPHHYSFPSNFSNSDKSKYTSGLVHHSPLVSEGSRSSTSSTDYYPYKEPNSSPPRTHVGTYLEADIVEPIIIPREKSPLRNAFNYNSEQTYPDISYNKDAHLKSYDSVNSDYQSYNLPAISSQLPVEPLPPVRHDSLSKNFQNSRVLSESNPIFTNNDTKYTSPEVYDQSFKYLGNSYNDIGEISSDKKPYTTYISCSNNTLRSSTSPNPMVNDNDFSNQSNYLVPTIVPTPPLEKEEAMSPSSNLPTPCGSDRLSPVKYFNNIRSDGRYLSPSYNSVASPSRQDEVSPWDSGTSVNESPQEEKAVSRVMGQAQCQQAVTLNSRTKRRFDLDLESELKLQLKHSAQKKSLSPSFPNVLQKSESWHQMVKEQMQQAKQAPPLPRISKAKSSHALAQPKQFEAALPPDSVTQKKITVSQYLAKQQARSVKSTKSNPKYKSTNTLHIQRDEDEIDMDNVDEVFESIFQETTKKRNSK